MNENRINEKEMILRSEPFYNKELNCKKNILECIEVLKNQDKEKVSEEEWQEIYNTIYSSIDKLSEQMKANTVLQLKNQLKAGIGKRVTVLDPIEVNTFVEFFKEAYPEGKRRKDFTWVLADPSKIGEDQILHTLKYISNWCAENRLDGKQKEDIKGMIEKLVKGRNIKYINQVKSLEGLRKDRVLGSYIKSIEIDTGKSVKKTYAKNTSKTYR